MSVFGAYSRYYNLFYKDKDYAGEAEYVHGLIRKHLPGAGRVLDLGCGTGRHDFLLAEKGYEVTGVDRSEEMLSVANGQFSSRAPRPASPVFHQGDICTVRLGKTFDVVVSLFHVISYQPKNSDLRAAFATASEHLEAGGLFIFDCWYGPTVLTDRPTVRVKRIEDDQIAVTRIVEPAISANDNLVELKYQVLIRDKESGHVDEVNETHRMRYLFRPEVELLLEEAGMCLVDQMEWLTCRQPGFDTWGVCFLAKK